MVWVLSLNINQVRDTSAALKFSGRSGNSRPRVRYSNGSLKDIWCTLDFLESYNSACVHFSAPLSSLLNPVCKRGLSLNSAKQLN